MAQGVQDRSEHVGQFGGGDGTDPRWVQGYGLALGHRMSIRCMERAPGSPGDAQ